MTTANRRTRDSVGYREVFRGSLGLLAAGLLVLEFAAAVQTFVTATVLPVVSDDLDGARYYGVALSAGTVALFAVTPATVSLMRRFGAPVLLIVAGGLHLAGTAISATAGDMPVFAFGRLVQGIGTGLEFALGYAIMAERFPAHLRPRLIALLTAMWLLPSLVGPGGTAALVALSGWRTTVTLSAVPMIVGLLLVIPRVRGEPEETSESAPVAWIAVATMTLGAGMVSLGGTSGGAAAIVLLGGGLALVSAGAVRVLPAGTVTGSRPAAAAVAALALATFAIFGADGLTTLYVTEGLGESLGWAAAALSTAGIAWTAGTFAQPRLLQRQGGRVAALVAVGGALVVAGLGLLIPVLILSAAPSTGWGGPAALGAVIAAWTMAGLGMGLLYPTFSVAALAVPQAEAAAMSSSIVLAEALGGTISLAVGGSLVSLSATATGGFGAGLLASSVVFAVAATAVVGYGRRAPGHLEV